MPWSLNIHHIDLQSAGDATLIVAHDTTSGISRSALIDGGDQGSALSIVDPFIISKVAVLDVMAATHYDRDHFNGLTALLNTGKAVYGALRIYDQGESGTYSGLRRQTGPGTYVPVFNRDNDYIRYVNAVSAYGGRTRVTEKVLSDDQPGVPPSWGGLPANWLLTPTPAGAMHNEILWDGVATGRPAGAPTLTCVAVNQYVLQAGPGAGTPQLTSGVIASVRQKNAKSLAFLLQFGNFKYYVGGDIEARQEDGSDWSGAGYTVNAGDRSKSMMNYLGRVHAFKTSHHGSKFSSSPAFLAKLQPKTAFISCGTDNQHGHPDQQVVTALDTSASLTQYFLTGEAVNGPAVIGPKGEVAGVWPQGTPLQVRPGHIQLRITQAQATAAPTPASPTPKFWVSYVQPTAGTNRAKAAGFAYLPFVSRVLLL